MTSPIDGIISRQNIHKLVMDENLNIQDDDERIQVLMDSNSIDVQACPGSGKTTLIAAKLMLLVKDWPYFDRGICVLSHTNVAKNEIIRKLGKSEKLAANVLLSYPHFIGTIQEFVGKFVAYPLIRSKGYSINQVDTENCVNMFENYLSPKTKHFLNNKYKQLNILYDFELEFHNDNYTIKKPKHLKIRSDTDTYIDLIKSRTSLIRNGYFFFRDIFVFAQIALSNNEPLINALQHRFSCVLLDEMQDTQKYQDEILRKIFPQDNPNLCIQRFGDPDQAIFHGTDAEKPNESFNNKSIDEMNYVIYGSHRFSEQIANKISGLSYNKIPLEAVSTGIQIAERMQVRTNKGQFKNTIIVYDHKKIRNVIPTFLDLVSSEFTDERKCTDNFTVKIVGAVGNKITDAKQIKIESYWPEYEKTNLSLNFQESSLVEAVRFCRDLAERDWLENYKFLINCVIKLLNLTNIRDKNGRYFNWTVLKDYFMGNEEKKWEDFQQLVYFWLNPKIDLDIEFWEMSNDLLCRFFDLEKNSKIFNTYLAFSEPQNFNPIQIKENEKNSNSLITLPENRIKHPSGFTAEISTIHGVKGETHDCTLVLETKNYCHDLEVMLPYLTKELPTNEAPNTALRDTVGNKGPNKQFMRQLYVGMSRPKHLLCLAIDVERISEIKINQLKNIGWDICKI